MMCRFTSLLSPLPSIITPKYFACDLIDKIQIQIPKWDDISFRIFINYIYILLTYM